MWQKKYLEIWQCIKEYKETKNIEFKKLKFLQCINAINNLKDWIKNDENIENKEHIKKLLSKNFFCKIANSIANADKHYKLDKGWYKIDDFIEIKTTNDLILKTEKKQINEDLVITKNQKLKEYKYLEIKPKINAYEILNNCLKEIHGIIKEIQTTK